MEKVDNNLLELYGVWYHPWWQSSYFYYFSVVVFCAIIILLSRIVFKFFKKETRISYRQSALQDLYRLESQMYVSEEYVHEAYFKVTMILKVYLSKRFNINLINKSDTEITESIESVVSPQMAAVLKEFFDRSFQIKFAYDSVSERMLRDDIAFVQKIIHDTNLDTDGMEKI